MQHLTHYIRQELEGVYTPSEISVLNRLILGEVYGSSFAGITEDKFSNLSGLQARKLEDILSRLKMAEPHQYVFGKSEFYGIEFRVTPDVLIPRPETEELVEWILSEHSSADSLILDIGTGSGCIAVALAKKLPNAVIDAWDLSERAISVAAENAFRNGVEVHFTRRDILQPFRREASYDVIVSNPPYVMESEKGTMERNVLSYEPHEALFVPDDNPLLFYERIAGLALEMLNKRGRLYFEINRSKGEIICEMLQERGFAEVELRKDISGNERMIRALKPDDHG
jgi:release factor glutamine methyltransferase